MDDQAGQFSAHIAPALTHQHHSLARLARPMRRATSTEQSVHQISTIEESYTVSALQLDGFLDVHVRLVLC